MMTLLLPSDTHEAHQQQQKILSIVISIENALLNITVSSDAEVTGAAAGLLGLSRIDASTLCGGGSVSQRITVMGVQDWRIKTDAADGRPIQTLLDDHVTVSLGPQVMQAWQEAPLQRHDPLATLTDAYKYSPLFRVLLHWHDNKSIEYHTLAIRIDTLFHQAQAKHSAHWPAVDIQLPANPQRLLFIINEAQVQQLSIRQATLQCVINAITRGRAPPDPMQERGIDIWLTNQVLLEMGDAFIPRINAALLDNFIAIDRSLAYDLAEQEDQYLERAVTDYQTPPEHGRFQGRQLATRPTVQEVIALLTRDNFPAYHRSAWPDVIDNAPTRSDFKRRFETRFEMDPGSRNAHYDEYTETMERFLFECYAGSSLFRHLFDQGLSTLQQRWTIYPYGFNSDADFKFDVLLPFDGMIDAGIKNAVYPGLIETAPDSINNSLSSPGPYVTPMEPMRRIMDGIVAVLSGDRTNARGQDAAMHRGGTVWITDSILWQAGWSSNKRLARILLPASDTASIERLSASASANRRAARAEDAALLAWLAGYQMETELIDA